jgi:telomere length regulation protein
MIKVNVQILLLCAGYAHRHAPSLLARLARSSDFLNGVSNRLAASSQRAKFLGMIVGETFSDLVHEDKKMKMSFDTEETQTDEARWWTSIPSVSDQVGTLSDLFITVPPEERKHLAIKATTTQSADTTVQVIPIVHSTDSEDDEFTPYALPDSDPGEASDEDATTIDRNKPSPPVYIRDLLSYLRASDSYDRQLLALTHASAIIRRKSTGDGSNNTGTEVSSHLDDLLSTLTTLDDRFEIPTFSLHRDAALISLAVTSPVRTGHWLSRQFFLGDYGLSQRATLLMVIGNAARELAGLVSPPEISKKKQLPGKVASVWGDGGGNSTSVSALASTLSKTLLAPLAASAADSLTGPNVLKVRTFSSRLAVEARRGKPIHRKILDVVGQAFFFPLTGGWWVAAKDYGGAQPHADAHLLSLFLNTLSVLVHAAGPAAPALGQMSSEFFELLLSLRGGAAGDVRVAEAVLLGMLTVLEVNVEAGAEGRRRLAEEHGREVVECKEWVEGVFDGVFGGEESVRRLAAGVLVKVGEVAEDYRRTLLGGLGIED